jgi:transketolase
MRNKFSEELVKIANKDKSIHIVVADISPAGSMEQFQKKFKNRFINVGVSEQAMIGIAAGLSLQKKIVFAYTIANFSLYRPFEMIRNDLCYQKLPVTVVGMGSGTIYANLGGTHLTQEDISIARSIPNMQILAPCDPAELSECIKYCAKNKKGPIYLRIGKSGEKIYSKSSQKWKFGKIRKIKNGSTIAILTFGPIIKYAFDGIEKKNEDLISIYSCHTIKPFDYSGLKKIFRKYKKIIILEDHSYIGGLGSIIKESAFESKYTYKIYHFSLKDEFLKEYSSQENLLKKHGISLGKLKNIINK